MSIKAKSITWIANENEILKDISLEIQEGEVFTIIGPNGAGKSSLLNIVSGDINPSSGEVSIDGRPLKDISIQERAFIRSVMSQSQAIVYDFTVKEIIEMGWIDRGSPEFSDAFSEAIDETSRECFVDHLLERKFNTLSGGEQRRVHFARTLLQLWRPSNSTDPKYMFLDEPTANLDLFHELKMMELIKKKSYLGTGILLILHDLNLASRFSDRVGIFKEGNIVCSGKPKEVYKQDVLSEVYGLPMTVHPESLRVSYY